MKKIKEKLTVQLYLMIAVLTMGISLSAQNITTYAGNGSNWSSGDGMQATVAAFSQPHGVATDGEGNLYICDYQSYRVRKVTAATGVITTVVGTGTSGFSGDGGLATAAQIGNPLDVAVDNAGNLYVSDDDDRIRKVDAVTGVITTIAGIGVSGYSGDGGLATAANISDAYRITVDANDNLYLVQHYYHRVRKIDAVTGIISTIIGTGANASSGDGGVAVSANVSTPFGVAVDDLGNVYVAESYRIRKIDGGTGIVTTIAGNGVNGSAGDGGLATVANIGAIFGMDFNAAGDLFFAGYGNHKVRKIDASTGVVSTVAGTGAGGFSGDGGLATLAQINFPRGICIDPQNNLFIAEHGNHRVRKVTFFEPCIPTTSSFSVSASTCFGYTVPSGDSTYTEVGTHTVNDTIDNAEGCDSVMTITITINQVVDQTVTIDDVSLCPNNSGTSVNVTSSEVGINYYLRDNENDTVVDGPVIGDGNGIIFNTGSITNSMDYNVIAALNGNGALDFDGQDDHVLASVGPGFMGSGAFSKTYEAWVKLDSYTGNSTIIEDRGKYRLWIDDAGMIHYSNEQGGMLDYIAVGGSAIPLNQWVHVAIIFDGYGAYGNFIIDDQVYATTNSSPVPWESSLPDNGLSIGANVSGSSNGGYLDGKVDNVQIWDGTYLYGQDESALIANMNVCVDGSEPGLELSYNFSDGSGLTTVDLSPNNYSGTLTNVDVNVVWSQGIGVCSSTAPCEFEMSDIVSVELKSTTTGVLDSTICYGASFEFNGTTYDANNLSGTETLVGANGCDSVVTVTVTELAPLTGVLDSTICYGASFEFNGTTYDANNLSGTETLMGANGCDSIVTVTVTELPALVGDHNETVCFGESIIVNGTTYNAGNLSGIEVFINVGPYNCDSTVTVNLTIEDAIDVSTVVDGITLTSSATGATYQWIDCSNNNEAITGETNASFTATANGDYAVVVTIGNCSDTSECETISSVGINENNISNEVSVYPNPSNGVFTLEIDELSSSTVRVYSLLGQELLNESITSKTTVIDLREFNNGTYFIEISSENNILIKKIVKQ